MRAPSAAMSSSSVRLQPVALEPPRRLFRGAGARQREHGAVLQPEIIGTLGETLLGEIDRGQQLASPLCVLDSLEPVGGRTLRRRRLSPELVVPEVVEGCDSGVHARLLLGLHEHVGGECRSRRSRSRSSR